MIAACRLVNRCQCRDEGPGSLLVGASRTLDGQRHPSCLRARHLGEPMQGLGYRCPWGDDVVSCDPGEDVRACDGCPALLMGSCTREPDHTAHEAVQTSG